MRKERPKARATAKRLFGMSFVLLAVAGVAAGEATAQTVLLRAVGGTGFNDGYRGGFGGSAGIEFPFIGGRPFFVGGRVVRHVGSDAILPESLGGPDVSGELDQLQYGLEFGATWVSSPIILRTSGGIGIARLSGAPDGGAEQTSSELLLQPGLILAVPIDDGRAFIGVEGKFLRVQNADDAFALYGTFGLRLGPR